MGVIVRDEGGGMRDEGGGMRADRQDLRKRTLDFSLRIIKLYGALPRSVEAQVLGKQLLRSGTSVGAQYREACRAKSKADFISKIEGSLQELDETSYWLELLGESGIIRAELLKPLQQETNELTAIFVTMAKGLKQRKAGDGVVIPHPSALIP